MNRIGSLVFATATTALTGAAVVMAAGGTIFGPVAGAPPQKTDAAAAPAAVRSNPRTAAGQEAPAVSVETDAGQPLLVANLAPAAAPGWNEGQAASQEEPANGATGGNQANAATPPPAAPSTPIAASSPATPQPSPPATQPAPNSAPPSSAAGAFGPPSSGNDDAPNAKPAAAPSTPAPAAATPPPAAASTPPPAAASTPPPATSTAKPKWKDDDDDDHEDKDDDEEDDD